MEKETESIPSPYLTLPVRLQWSAQEYHHTQKSNDWYWTVWVIALSLTIVSILFGNIIFGVLIVATTLGLSLLSTQQSSILPYEINEKGIISNRYFYPYDTLESFGIDLHSMGNAKLIIKSKKMLMPFIIIPLENVDTEEVRYILGTFIHDENHQEPLFHKIMDYLGF